MATTRGAGGPAVVGNAGQFVIAQFNMTGLTLLRNAAGEFTNSDVNRELFEREAQAVQKAQVKFLNDKIVQRGRPQRGNLLQEDILSGSNREVNSDGFKVGVGMRDGEAKAYSRGVDLGTSAHVGRLVTGYFYSTPTGEGGRPNAPGVTDRDARLFQVRDPIFNLSRAELERRHGTLIQTNPPVWEIHIRNAIVGYRYTEGGFNAWREDGGLDRVIKDLQRNLVDALKRPKGF